MIQSLGENSKIIAIPRIRFKFRLPFGQSSLADPISSPTSVSHVCQQVTKTRRRISTVRFMKPTVFTWASYVALSRVRDASKVAIFTKPESTLLGHN